MTLSPIVFLANEDNVLLDEDRIRSRNTSAREKPALAP